jgi:[lysine-biosynthesis-protein LysW]--L-2-aminoadipate ligase
MRIGILYSRLRVEEKWLFAALDERDIEYDRLLDREVTFDLTAADDWQRYDAVIIRSLSTSRGLYAAQALNSIGVPTINPHAVAAVCSDKVSTTTALTRAGLPQPRTRLAFTAEAALAVGEELGYPYVVKPVVGSWGRLVNRINDRDAAEAVFEHREVLGRFQHHLYYIQELIEKPGRDIRAFVIGDQTPVAIYRHSEHWLTNTARGATASECTVTPDLHQLCQRATQAVGGGVLAIDLLEDPERGLLINEINHTMEFHSTVPLTGVDLPGMIVDHTLATCRLQVKNSLSSSQLSSSETSDPGP